MLSTKHYNHCNVTYFSYNYGSYGQTADASSYQQTTAAAYGQVRIFFFQWRQ